jgi:hypothetical protein
MEAAHALLKLKAGLACWALHDRRVRVVLGREHVEPAGGAFERDLDQGVAASHLPGRSGNVNSYRLADLADVGRQVSVVLDVSTGTVDDQRSVECLKAAFATSVRALEIEMRHVLHGA